MIARATFVRAAARGANSCRSWRLVSAAAPSVRANGLLPPPREQRRLVSTQEAELTRPPSDHHHHLGGSIPTPSTPATNTPLKETSEAGREAARQAEDICSAEAKTTAAGTKHEQSQPAKKFRPFRPRKAAMTLSPSAVRQLRRLLDQPEPKLIKIGLKNKGCSGLSYDLQYVDRPERLDEVVEQDGVRLIIDNRALMNVIGSEMDWVEDVLSQRFVFRNPNIKQACGCGESFMT